MKLRRIGKPSGRRTPRQSRPRSHRRKGIEEPAPLKSPSSPTLATLPSLADPCRSCPRRARIPGNLRRHPAHQEPLPRLLPRPRLLLSAPAYPARHPSHCRHRSHSQYRSRLHISALMSSSVLTFASAHTPLSCPCRHLSRRLNRQRLLRPRPRRRPRKLHPRRPRHP